MCHLYFKILFKVITDLEVELPHEVIDAHKVWEWCHEQEADYVDSSLEKNEDGSYSLYIYIQKPLEFSSKDVPPIDTMIEVLSYVKQMGPKKFIPADAFVKSVSDKFQLTLENATIDGLHYE